MKISEIIKLIAAGFKASEIRAFIEDEKKDETPAPPPEPAPTPEDPAEEKDMKPDYEALYEKALDEIADTKKQLEAAQAANRSAGRTDPSPSLDDDFKKVQDLMRR